jgi:hypothetical protein
MASYVREFPFCASPTQKIFRYISLLFLFNIWSLLSLFLLFFLLQQPFNADSLHY